ncbi:type II toxin-antitoxin system VapC family toxin [Nitrospirillum viridazoti]|uniref:Ribonuclease VapC n=1 Tax=Nitrospirillum viridazoti CBAmc TaxID=1441467 RepID=A0A248JY57_9PROT|nr:type II toxin-antitoxin system VapC family toxin [Nitrospirillum amazonense]ASG23078.1 VapC toxin family PIN domain ribonuclease [Nitrospirillum amazonense CBAmc]TWB38811.1 tRNA(fMet)-specific endonuclease VapC [Nitrospirillum amazonense]
MKFLLDTNAVIAVMKGDPVFLDRMRQHRPEDFGLPTIVAHELYFGAAKSQRAAENLARVEALRFPVLDLDREDARQAGLIRAQLAATGTPVGPYDVLIAGQALARGLTLVTHNTREFQRVPGLHLEDWQ